MTGGAQGVGEGIACELAAEGASGITIADIDETKGLAVQQSLVAAGCKAVFVCADLAKPAECQRVIAEHEAAFHRVDGLVNCAASTARGHWDDTSAEFFDASAFFTASIPLTNRFLSRAVRRVTQEQPWCLCCCRRACCVAVMALNARAPLLLMQGAGRLMERDGRGGSIVNIGSVHCHGGMPKLVAYAASKAALLNLVSCPARSSQLLLPRARMSPCVRTTRPMHAHRRARRPRILPLPSATTAFAPTTSPSDGARHRQSMRRCSGRASATTGSRPSPTPATRSAASSGRQTSPSSWSICSPTTHSCTRLRVSTFMKSSLAPGIRTGAAAGGYDAGHKGGMCCEAGQGEARSSAHTYVSQFGPVIDSMSAVGGRAREREKRDLTSHICAPAVWSKAVWTQWSRRTDHCGWSVEGLAWRARHDREKVETDKN